MAESEADKTNKQLFQLKMSNKEDISQASSTLAIVL